MNLAEYSNNSAQLDAIVESHRSFSSGQYVVAVLPYYCVRIPLVVMESIGYFDTSFGNGGGEDFDYSLRAHLAGFDTHYALGSYMLHFGGKSTWAGETEQHNQADRQEQYHRVFREKWGENLYRFILQEDASILDQVKLSKETAGTGVARAIIKELKGDLEITLKIPRKPGSIH
jgi:GT2 family glycosyltransferase